MSIISTVDFFKCKSFEYDAVTDFCLEFCRRLAWEPY